MKLVKIARTFIIGASISLFSIAAAYANDTIKLEGTVTGDVVNIRMEPSMKSEVLGKTYANSNVVLTGKVGQWYSLEYNGEVAYIHGDYVNCDSAKLLPEKEVEISNASDLGQQVVDYATQFIGTPYVYGGTSLTNGVDCSGFTSSVMKKFGIHLSRRSSDQLQDGTKVSKSELEAGDLVFFNTSGSGISHVGIYIGDGKFIHSATARGEGVKIDKLSDKYYANTYVSACRVVD
jgi:hypothetical protein